MEGILVSSRMTRAKKEAGVAVLDSLGATTSDLINNAFDYVIEMRALPLATPRKRRSERGFEAFVRGSTLQIPWGAEDVSYDQILRDGKLADYESLA